MKQQINKLSVSLNEKEAEIIELNMKLADEKRSAFTLQRDLSRGNLQRDTSKSNLQRDQSRNSVLGYESSKHQLESQVEAMTKDRDKLEKRIRELELEKIKVFLLNFSNLNYF